MPELFSPDFLHQLSSLLPHLFYRCCRARKSERKSTEQGGEKKKKKTSESSLVKKGEEGKQRKGITLLWFLLRLLILRLREEALAMLFWMRLPFSSTGSHFSALLQELVWQELGKSPPGRNARLLPVRFWLESDVVTVIHLGVWAFMWPYDYSCEPAEPTHWTSPLPFSFCGLFHYVSMEVSVVAEAAIAQKWVFVGWIQPCF